VPVKAAGVQAALEFLAHGAETPAAGRARVRLA
jgi:hypothetical protein